MNARDALLGFLVGLLLMSASPSTANHGGLGNHASAYCQSPTTAVPTGFIHNVADGTRQTIYTCLHPDGTAGQST